MIPIRKQFDTQPAFPFALNYRDTKSAQSELPHHVHDWYELVYVHSGKGSFFIDRTIDEMRRGDLFLIPGNTIHRAFPDAEDPVTSTAVFFSPTLMRSVPAFDSFSYLRIFDQCRMNRRFKLVCPPDLIRLIEERLSIMDDEYKRQQAGYRHSLLLQIQLILLEINREYAPGQQSGSPNPFIGPRWMKDILLFIDEHYHEPISLGRLCLHASVSAAHFSRVFKQLTGVNVTDYVTMKRVIRAKELLLESDDNISTVAAACGFDSLPHFHRKFKQIAGVTPSAYRKNGLQ